MRLITGFKTMKDSDLLAKSGVILVALSGNPVFPEPWPAGIPSLAEITQARTAFQEAYAAAQTRDTTKIAAKNVAFDTLAEMLNLLAGYLAAVAGNDEAKLNSSGFDVRQPADRHAHDGVLPAPDGVKLSPGGHSGAVELNAQAVAGARAYESQITQGDPTVAANWQHLQTTAGCKHIQVANLTPGQIYWFRLRAIGKDAPGYWSAEAKIMVV